jgi:Rad3-related DNA helicase
MVASGLYEGVDLAGDLGRWQLLLKVPYPSLGDPAIKHKAETSAEWFCWETLRPTLQSMGRICRGPDDQGTSYVLDAAFERLYSSGLSFGLIPSWFKSAVK